MKNFILILFFLPICLFSQSWKDGKSSWKETKKTTNNSKITKCDCARAMMVSLMVSGFKDEDDLSSIEKNQMDKIESTYNNVCEKYMNDFISGYIKGRDSNKLPPIHIYTNGNSIINANKNNYKNWHFCQTLHLFGTDSYTLRHELMVFSIF